MTQLTTHEVSKEESESFLYDKDQVFADVSDIPEGETTEDVAHTQYESGSDDSDYKPPLHQREKIVFLDTSIQR